MGFVEWSFHIDQSGHSSALLLGLGEVSLTERPWMLNNINSISLVGFSLCWCSFSIQCYLWYVCLYPCTVECTFTINEKIRTMRLNVRFVLLLLLEGSTRMGFNRNVPNGKGLWMRWRWGTESQKGRTGQAGSHTIIKDRAEVSRCEFSLKVTVCCIFYSI